MWRERSEYSGKLVVEVDYLPGDEYYIINQTQPKCQCPGSDCPETNGRLCDACWFQEFAGTVGFETIVDDVTWEGKGKKESTLRITGHMWFESTSSIDYGWDCDEGFEVEKIEALPEPVCYCGMVESKHGSETHIFTEMTRPEPSDEA